MDSNKRIKILVISGGGVWGILPCRFLREVSKQDVAKIDVVSGTSVGGILALYLASRQDTNRMFYDFKQSLPIIFKRNFWRSINPFKSRYSQKGIEQVLQNLLIGRVSDVGKKFVVPSFGFKRQKPVIFHNFDETFNHYDLWKIGRATSAAPVFFPPYSENIFLDGGILQNIPIMTTASIISKYKNIKPYEMDVFVIGTGKIDADERKQLHQVKKYSALKWLRQLLPFVVTGGNEMMSAFWGENLGFNSFTLFNPVALDGKMDDINKVTSGQLQERCELYIGSFKQAFSKFISS